MDEDELLGEFVYGTYSAQLYDRFKDWVNSDILFYMKSKALYYDYDSKFPEKFTIKELAKDLKPVKGFFFIYGYPMISNLRQAS